MKKLISFFVVLFSMAINAQNLTISTSGQTGTSGINWSTSGSNPVIITASGAANINTSVITGYLNAGKNLNLVVSSGNVIIKSKIATNATAENLRFSIYNQSKGFINLTAEGSILASSGNLDVLLQTKGSINMAASATIASNGGTIRLQAIEETGRLKRTAISEIALMGTVNASSDTKGGKIFIESDAIQLHSSARVFAKGKRGGGTILIGGDWQGGSLAEKRETETMQQAITVTMVKGAIVDASATENGDGGKVVLWSNLDHPASNTQAHGQLLAMGKGSSGRGGMIETSGAAINFDGVAVSSIATNGTAGEWLIDPHNLYFSTSDLNNIAANLINNNIAITTSTNTNPGAGASNNIYGRGHIVFRDNFTYTGFNARTLTLTADQDIWINNNITSTGGALSLNFNAGNRILLDAGIATNGGAVTFNDGSNVHFQQTSGTQNLNTGGGTLAFNSANVFLLKHSGSLVVNTANGSLNLGTGTIQQINTYNQINAISALLNSWQGANAGGSRTYGINVVAGREYSTRMYFWDSWDSGEQGQLFVRKPDGNIDYYFQGERGGSNGGFSLTSASNGAQFSASAASNIPGGNDFFTDAFVDVTFVAVNSGRLETWTNLNQDANDESLELLNFYETQFPSFSYTSGSRSLSLNTTSGQIVGSTKDVSDVANFTVNTNNNLGSIGGFISGTTNFIKEGTGAFTLTQNNSYSGNTTINAGTLVLQNNAPNPNNKTFNDPGALRIESTATAFTSAFSTTGWSFGGTLSGLIFGKTTNTANVTFGSATAIAGPITAFGGTITLNANLTTTNNADISLFTNNALGGLTTARTLTAAGAFRMIPQSDSFAADVIYPITNLTATSTGLTIGKITNTRNITINQAVTGGAGILLYGGNVAINSNLTTTGSGNMLLKGTATVAAGRNIESAGNFTQDGNITFKSNATATASFGRLGATYTTTSGTVTTERYIPAKRAFRFLSPSVTTTSSIHANWQEAGRSTANLGTHITGAGSASNGFDASTTNNPSLFTYTGGSWQAVTNTNTSTLTAGTGYRLMVRGDRTLDLTTNTPNPTPTVLRATGTLKQAIIVQKLIKLPMDLVL